MKKQLWTIILMAPVLLSLAAILVSILMSPPRGGKVLAERIGIPYPAIIAHRGASYLAPDATAPAFLLARDIGANYLEADLQRTKDGVIIAFHDDTPWRTTNAKEVYPGRENDYIETFTYEELLLLDAGSWFNREYPERARESYEGLKILTLAELIDIAETGGNKPGLYLEVKAPRRQLGIEEEIVAILQNKSWIGAALQLPLPDPGLNQVTGAPLVNDVAKPAGRVIFQSFYPESIEKLKELAPEAPRVQLISAEMAKEDGFHSLLKQAAAMANGIGPAGYLGYPWQTGAAHRAGLVVHHYTINTGWQMRLLSFFGADGVFTDRSELALVVYGKATAIDLEAAFRQIGY